MIFTARFGAAQSNLGFQFYDGDGVLLGDRDTINIVDSPEAGSYIGEATPPAEAVGIYWNDTVTLATALEDLREALAIIALPSAPTAAAIADAVWDEPIAGHATAGTTGAQLSAAGAAGDPWATVVPAAYADGTAGAAIGRLNNTPAEAPVIIIPDPSDDTNDCVVYIDTQEINNEVTEGVIFKFTLSDKAKTGGGKVLGFQITKEAITDVNGRAEITLERTDAMTPDDREYIVVCEAYGINDRITLTAETYNLSTLIA